MKNLEPKGPLFIVGMPRSGTKLLRGLLNNHSMIVFPNYETEFLPYWVTHWSMFGDLMEISIFEKFYESVKKSSFFYYMKRHKGHYLSANEWHSACKGWGAAEIFEALVRLDTEVADGNIWGDKSPSYIRHIPLLCELYPNAKVIHIVRDVRDYCISINKAWGKNMLRAAQRWVDDTAKASNDLKSFEGSGIEIRFEDLLSNPSDTVEKLCYFIGVPFEKKMLNLTSATENIGDARGEKKIVNTNKGKWRKELDPSLIRRIEEISSSQLTRYNYPVNYQGAKKRIGKFQMNWYRLLDFWNLVTSDTDDRGLLKNFLFYIQYAKFSGNRIP